MKVTKNTLLAGIAALALVAGTGFASAQEQSKEHKGAAAVKEPHAQPMNKGEAAPGGKAGQSAEERAQEKGQGAEPNAKGAAREHMAPSTAQEGGKMNAEQEKRAQETNRANKSEKMNAGENRAVQDEREKDRLQGERNKAESEHNKANPSTATEERNRHGGAGTAEQGGRKEVQGRSSIRSNANYTLTNEQRTKIRQTVIQASGAPHVANVNFNVTVGTVVPRDEVVVVPVPQTLVEIEPDWTGFYYFIYQDELVLVDPNDMTIVAVVSV